MRPKVDLSSTRHRAVVAAVAAIIVVAAIVIVGRGGEATVEAQGERATSSTASVIAARGTTGAPGTLAAPAADDPTGAVPGTTPATAADPTPTTAPDTTAAPAEPTTTPVTTAPTTATTVAPTTQAPPPPTTARRSATSPPPPPPPTAPRSTAAFRGLGAWLDVLDWSPSYDENGAQVGLADIDAMAAHGVQTLYVQTSRYNRDEDVLDPAVLLGIINRAHAKGMKVVGWYLPTHQDLDRDLRRLVAAANLPVDALGVDIESTLQTDLAERNRQVVELSTRLRSSTTKPLAAIVIPPVVTNIINTKYWPEFPWRSIATLYDVYLPMGYFTGRTKQPEWRDAYTYTKRNIELVRELTGRRVDVHAVGGIADETTTDDVAGLVRAVADEGALGGSLYDYVTTVNPELWTALQPLRR